MDKKLIEEPTKSIKPILATHRGVDLGASSGVHLHASTTTDTVKSWANSIATSDNDMVYLRKKNGILYVMKSEPHTAGVWEKLDPKDTPVIIDEHGARLEDLSLAALRAKLIASDTPPEVEAVPGMEVGWYQDQKAELYYYEGEGHWREVDLKTNKSLTKMVVAGTLEFIG